MPLNVVGSWNWILEVHRPVDLEVASLRYLDASEEVVRNADPMPIWKVATEESFYRFVLERIAFVRRLFGNLVYERRIRAPRREVAENKCLARLAMNIAPRSIQNRAHVIRVLPGKYPERSRRLPGHCDCGSRILQPSLNRPLLLSIGLRVVLRHIAIETSHLIQKRVQFPMQLLVIVGNEAPRILLAPSYVFLK